jgi:hypothetical protein
VSPDPDELARRDRYRRALMARLTPEQRMERFWALQAYCFAEMMKSPGAYERYWRRNLKKRATPARDDDPTLPK